MSVSVSGIHFPYSVNNHGRIQTRKWEAIRISNFMQAGKIGLAELIHSFVFIGDKTVICVSDKGNVKR